MAEIIITNFENLLYLCIFTEMYEHNMKSFKVANTTFDDYFIPAQKIRCESVLVAMFPVAVFIL